MGILEQVITPLPTSNVRQSNNVPMAEEQETGRHRNFNARFKTYLTRNLTYIYRLVTTAEGALSDELRNQVTHTLTYGFELEANWPVARDLLLATAPDMELAGYREDWLPFLQRGMTKGLEFNDMPAVAECRLQIGMIHRMVGEFDRARQVLLESVAGFASLQSPRNQARALNELAWLEQLQQHYVNATSHVEAAMALLGQDDPEQAVCLRVQGMIAIGHHRWEEAEALHREALRRFEANGDERRRAWSIQNIGYAIHGQKRYEEAIDLYRQAASLLANLQDRYHWAMVQNNLGLAYQDTEQSVLAVECFENAIQIAESVSDKLLLARLNTNLGLSYLAVHEYVKAERCFRYSATLHRTLGTIGLCVNAQDGLAMALIALQEYTSAVSVIEDALAMLPQVQSPPLYQHLSDSLKQHLEQARNPNHLPPHDSTSILF